MEQVFHIQQLLSDLSGWLMGLIPIGGGLMVGYHALMKNLAQDEHQAAAHSRSIRNVLVGTAIGLGASALIGFIQNYVG